MRKSPADRAGDRGLESRFNGLFFWSYCLLAVYGTMLNLYFKRQGMSGTGIGTLSAVFSLVAVVLTPAIGARFDTVARRPARFLAALGFLSGLSFLALSLPVPFVALAFLMAVLAMVYTPVIPILNSLSLHHPVFTRVASRGFGGFRRWGSLGFAVAAVSIGWLVQRLGIGIIFPAYAVCAFIVGFLALGIPPEKAHAHGKPHGFLRSVSTLLGNRPFIVLCLLTMAGSIGGSISWPFRSIYLDSIRVPEMHIGLLLVLPILAEVAVFTWGEEMIRRWGPVKMLLAGNVLAGLRWWLLTSVTFLPFVYAVEILHGVSFALSLMGTISLIRAVVPPVQGTTGQVLLNSSFSGTGGALGAFVGGLMFDALGVVTQLRVGGVILALSGVLVVLSWRDEWHNRRDA